VVIYCNPVVNPTQTANACPMATTQFCENVPIDDTSSSQAEDACDVCNGSCSPDPPDAVIGGWNAWTPSISADGPVYYVYGTNPTPGAATVCTNATYSPVAGDILSAGTCPESRWAP
jgi:hypothetical protein